jgi:hypothetical protein
VNAHRRVTKTSRREGHAGSEKRKMSATQPYVFEGSCSRRFCASDWSAEGTSRMLPRQ